MKRIPLFVTSASLVLALSVALPVLGVTTNFNASRFDLASPLLFAGVAVLGSSLALLIRFRQTTQQVAATRSRHRRSL
jgi:hypothetical protein